jgi:hypothetical protein
MRREIKRALVRLSLDNARDLHTADRSTREMHADQAARHVQRRLRVKGSWKLV